MRAAERPSVATELIALFLMELANWRWSWRILVFGGAFAPLAVMAGLGVFASDAGPEAVSYVLTGNVVLTLLLGNMDTLQSRFVYMRLSGALDYYRTLPIRRVGLIVAMVAAFLLLSLPGVVVTILAGTWLLHIPLDVSPLLLLVIPLAALPMAAIGALIGLVSPTPEFGNGLRFLAAVTLIALGPVLFPPQRLPEAFLWIGRLSPATYASSALRQTLLGPITRALLIDLSVLLGMSLGAFWLIANRLDWRGIPRY